MKQWLVTAACTAFLLTPTLLLAQEKGDTGITMGYPASIGLLWHASDKLAIRPEIALSHTSSETDTPIGSTEGSSNGISVGGSVLFSLRKWDRVQTYAGPRYTYSRTSSHTESSVLTIESESVTNSHAFAGYFGAQFSPHQRFSIFGEIGAGVTRSSGGVQNDLTDSHSTTVSTRTGVGVIFYF
jgi:hypothetical protein